MLEYLSLFGIVLGLGLLIYGAYRGHSVIWVAPACAVVVAAMSCVNLLDSYLGDYVGGVTSFIASWLPVFFLSAIYGKIMDRTGAARSFANKMVAIIGSKRALLAVVLSCMLMTYGGVSVFVVVFVVYPIGYAIFREANIPRSLLPSAIGLGSFGITMTSLPGTPQMQNLLPTEYFGTTATAAPIMGLIAAVFLFAPGYLYLEWRIRQMKKKGLGFVEDPKYLESEKENAQDSLPHWLVGIVPLFVVVLTLNLLPVLLETSGMAALSSNQSLVVALVAGILVACLLNLKRRKALIPAFNDGAIGSASAIMNTSSAVGFGAVIKAVPGFALLKSGLLNMPGPILFSESVAVNIFGGATGSALGGLTITLDTLGEHYLAKAIELGIDPEYLHRIVAIASGGLSGLPHNGTVLMLFAISNCKYKESYPDFFISSCISPVVVSFVFSFIWEYMVI